MSTSLFSLFLFIFFASTSICSDVAIDEAIEDEFDFHPRGIQQFKGNSHRPFQILTVIPEDSRNNNDSWFRFQKLESINVRSITTPKNKEPIFFLNISTPPIIMRLYFNPGEDRVTSLTLNVSMIYRDEQGFDHIHELPFSNSSGALLCPKAERYEFGRCHYRADEDTFEELTLPLDEWPVEARGATRKNSMSVVTLDLIKEEKGEQGKKVMGASFFALYF